MYLAADFEKKPRVNICHDVELCVAFTRKLCTSVNGIVRESRTGDQNAPYLKIKRSTNFQVGLIRVEIVDKDDEAEEGRNFEN